jgi:hypothetical protein
MPRRNDPLLKIKSMKKFIKFLAITTAKDCGINLKEEKVKNYINSSNIRQIIYQYAKRNKYGDCLINNKILAKIKDELMSWILGVILAKSAAKNEIECSWDDKRNCMIFKYNS